MKKIIVIGCPGSGKSTFSKELHKVTNIPLYHLDMIYWNSDRTRVEKVVFREKLIDILEKDEWIIDGDYLSTLELRLESCDTVFFLDYSVDVCLEGINDRIGKVRSDIPWVEYEIDSDFVEYVKTYSVTNRSRVIEILNKSCDKNIYIFKNRSDALEYLTNKKMKLKR